MASTTTVWKGDDYDRISGPHADMGTPALDRLVLDGDERVLDVGCGSGRVTERLLERLPSGSAIALDGSASMLEEAQRRLARFGDRVTYLQADLGTPPLPIEGEVDAIMSTATLHWVIDHDALFEGLSGVIRPGGQLSFQCGGEGNAAAMIEAVHDQGVETRDSFHMAGVEETTARLEVNGFEDIEAWLQPQTIAFETRADMLDYIVTPYLRPATGLPDEDLYRLADGVTDRLGVLAIDYVRLNVTARKG
ncbi:MAG: methyltransferase domain-containing protein [Chloroflexota bacterium]|nr:methyltransferase domain-containing protein [Chloroflexota bacterium]